MTPDLSLLNPPQREAVLHPRGPLLILAGAGSGKTRVITCRLAELTRRGVDPRRILAVTFTNKAAGEMRERTRHLLSDGEDGNGGDALWRRMWIGTFHATCARLLRIYGERLGLGKDFVVFDDGDQMTLVGQVLRELNLSAQVATPRAVLSAIDRAKNHGKGPDSLRGRDYFADLVARVYERYQERLREMNAVDFGDLLLLPLELARRDEAARDKLARLFDHVLVDEFQDVNQVQNQLLCLLAERSRELVVVGDDDQAIYGWRGADVSIILRFTERWPDAKVVRLEQNYRSTQRILQAANGVIAKNHDRYQKTLFTEKHAGAMIVCHAALDERREANFVAETIERLCKEERRSHGDFAICYRVNAQSRVLEESLRQCGIPYTVVGGMRFFDRAEVKDVLCYLRLCHNPADEVALRRVINVPPRGIGDTTIEKLTARARAGGVTLWQALHDSLHSDDGLLRAGARKKLQDFVDLCAELQQLRAERNLAELTEAVLEKSGYLQRLAVESGPESASRRENVMELVGSIRERMELCEREGGELTLTDFLEQVSLASSVDAEGRGVSLMTVHAAKGLEFPVVFVTGLEDGLFPSLRRGEEEDSRDSDAEERRLAYVAITRAKERLLLSFAWSRRLYGQMPKVQEPSRFLAEIPAACLSQQGARRGPVNRSRWDDEVSYGSERPRFGQGFGKGRAAAAGGGEDWGDEVRVVREEEGVRPRARPGAAAASGGGLRVEYEDAPDARGSFRMGQLVTHEQFGRGEVRGFSGAGDKLKLVVYFPSAGAKTVLARFVTSAAGE